MKKLFFYLFLSLILHSLLFIPIHFSNQKTYKIEGQNQIVQARLIIAEPELPQRKTMKKVPVESSIQSVPFDKSVPFYDKVNVSYRFPRQAEDSSMDFMTASAKQRSLKKTKKVSTKRVKKALKSNHQKLQQKKLSGEQTSQLITIVYQAVHKNKVYPLQSRRLHHQGRVLIAFSLLPTGFIKDAAVKKSSGYIDLDKAALKAIRVSQPFKIEQLLSAKQDMTIPIVYRLAKH